MSAPVDSASGLPAASVEEAREATCASCGVRAMSGFYEVESIPTQSCVLLESESEAVSYPVGDLLLAICDECGFIQNVRFDPNKVDYSKPTEESQAFSPRFQAFARELATELVESHDLVGRSILEVGCGKGDFINLLVDAGVGSAVGIDPGFLPQRSGDPGERTRFVRDWYDPRYLDETADLILTRHLLEHVHNVGEFLSWLVESTRRTEGARLFTEVPDVTRVLVEGAFWDVYYEHCSYFSPGSLGRALRRAGMEIEYLDRGFDDQYLLATSAPGATERPSPHSLEEAPGELADLAVGFARAATAARTAWRDRIDSVLAGGGRVCLWGGGSKAIAFLTSLGWEQVPSDLLVVDINVHKQGKWLPGSGVCVSSPDRLTQDRPDLVIPMNSVYVDEISSDLAAMGLSPRIHPV